MRKPPRVTLFPYTTLFGSEDLPTPKPAAGEILIKVRSVSVNRTLDCTVRAGKYPVEIHMPHVLGVDPAGDVVEVGDRKSTRLNSSHLVISYAVFCMKKQNK